MGKRFWLCGLCFWVFGMHCYTHTVAIVILSVCPSIRLSHWWNTHINGSVYQNILCTTPYSDDFSSRGRILQFRSSFLTLLPPIPLRLYTLPYWSNPTIFNFWHSGVLALRTERQSAWMSKIKNGGLDQYGAGPFKQQQFGTAGVEGANGEFNRYTLCQKW